MTTSFHTFTLDWLPDSLTWSVDGTAIRTLYAKDGDSDAHQYPQTPSRFHLGVWDAGGPNVARWTANWAGGSTDVKGFPYTAFVKSVKISPYKPCAMYNYTDTTGSGGSVKCISASYTVLDAGSLPLLSSGNIYPFDSICNPVHKPVEGSARRTSTAAQPPSVSSSQALVQTSAQSTALKTSDQKPNIALSGSTSSTAQMSSFSTRNAIRPTTAASASMTAAAITTTQSPTASVTTSSSQSKSSSTSPAPAANTPAAVPSNTKVTCPASDKASYVTPRGTYQIECSTDYANGDLQSSGSFSNGQSAASFQVCIDRCASFADGKCAAVNFIGTDGAGACYLKGPAGATSSRPGVQAATTPVAVTAAATGTSPTGAGVATQSPLVCNQDNCLRNLMDARFTKTASAFCSTFTRSAVQTLATTLDAVSNCEGNFQMISSACTCLMAPTGK
ncbi:Uu.00g036920.m01.CDS01 [Anthostomella pinea]|uniref:Uu.00g036920.m01.CDS01 n=1 Tax=Anthostomella pinea TaxID=933095 RepID=A0AAI8V9I5_9PEZI|nr:Uu.00g036920.m01.CDS01 [Anthostomella pinea]